MINIDTDRISSQMQQYWTYWYCMIEKLPQFSVWASPSNPPGTSTSIASEIIQLATNSHYFTRSYDAINVHFQDFEKDENMRSSLDIGWLEKS